MKWLWPVLLIGNMFPYAAVIALLSICNPPIENVKMAYWYLGVGGVSLSIVMAHAICHTTERSQDEQ